MQCEGLVRVRQVLGQRVEILNGHKGRGLYLDRKGEVRRVEVIFWMFMDIVPWNA
jgi:hypothetical protein